MNRKQIKRVKAGLRLLRKQSRIHQKLMTRKQFYIVAKSAYQELARQKRK